ncbi:unnamed protein product [Symbiodinium sp. KB8]|nr:unnamed protein product [Symbiodinium sp. KB8]
MAADSVQDLVLLESDVEDLELLELSCARAEILVFRVQANNDALCIFRGKFAKSVPSSKDASRSRLRHLCSIPWADVRLLFDSCPDVICIWLAETVRHMQQGDKLTWASFRAAFPIPDECLEATQKRIRLCVNLTLQATRHDAGDVQETLLMRESHSACLLVVSESLKLSLHDDLATHLLTTPLRAPTKSTLWRARTELDLASMIYARRFLLSTSKTWYLHMRADASPQAGRDYLVTEADICSFGGSHPATSENAHVKQLLSQGCMDIRCRLLPVSIVGARCASACHKGHLMLKSLALECENLQEATKRVSTLMFDYGAEAGIWSLPDPADSSSRLFANALPIADCDHGIHHAPRLRLLHLIWVLGPSHTSAQTSSQKYVKEHPEVMSELPIAFSGGGAWSNFRDTLASISRAFGSYHLLGRFRNVCIGKNPAVPEAYRRVFKDLFKSPCPKLTEHRWMYLHEDGDEDSVPFDEVYSLDLIAEVCDASSIKGAEFWLMCGLCRSLAAWGHRFSGMLHGCPCHTHEEKMEAKSKGKQRKRSAATASEDVLCLPGSFLPVATDGVAVPEKCPMEGRMAVALAGGLHEEAVAGLQESARKLSRHTQLALERLQGLDASRCLRQCRRLAKIFVASYDATENKAVAHKFLARDGPYRERQNKDLETPAFQKNLRHLLSSIGELYPGPWRSKTELIERVSKLSAEALFDDMAEERAQLESFKQGLATVASSASRQKQPVSDLEASLRREHIRTVLAKGKCYTLCGCVRPGVWSVFRVLNINPAANMYMQRCVHLAEDVFWHASSDWRDCIAVELLNGTEGSEDGPPEKVVTHEVEIVTLSIPKLFEKQTCDFMQLHEYQHAARIDSRVELMWCFGFGHADESFVLLFCKSWQTKMVCDVASAAVAHGGTVPLPAVSLPELAPAVGWMMEAGILQNGSLLPAYVTVQSELSQPQLCVTNGSRLAIAEYLKQQGWQPVSRSLREASLETKRFNSACFLEYHLILRWCLPQLTEYAAEYGFPHGASKGYYSALRVVLQARAAATEGRTSELECQSVDGPSDSMMYVPPGQSAEFYRRFQDWLQGEESVDPRVRLGLLQPKQRVRKKRTSLQHELRDDGPGGEGEPDADADALENCDVEMEPSDGESDSESDSIAADLDYGQPASPSPQAEQREPDQAINLIAAAVAEDDNDMRVGNRSMQADWAILPPVGDSAARGSRRQDLAKVMMDFEWCQRPPMAVVDEARLRQT